MDYIKKTAFLIIALWFTGIAASFGQDCNIISKANDIHPDRLCAPVNVSWEVTYRGVNDGGTGNVQFQFDWDDGNGPTLVNAINVGAGEWTYTENHTYPVGGDKCNYHPTVYLVVDGQTCSSSVQEQIVTVWDTDDQNGGDMVIDPQTFPICYGNDGTVTFTDVSQWNCTPPDENDVPNSRKRWIQWIYGTGGTNITTAEVNGVVESYPFAGPVNMTNEPILGPVAPYNQTLPIHIPAGYNVGDFFEVTLRNWNYCNPYDDPNIPGPPSDAINGDFDPVETTAIAIIVALPDGTITAVGPFCENELPVHLNAATPGGIWSGPGIINTSTGIFDPETAGPGIHTINYDVTNADGCSTTGTTTIQVFDAPEADITNGDAAYACPGITITLDGNPSQGTTPYTHDWSGDTGPLNVDDVQNPDFNTGTPGTYNLIYRVTDSNSCYDEDTIDVVVSPVDIQFNNNDVYLCTGVQDTLKPDPTGGSGVYLLHQWSGTRTDLLSATDVENPAFISPTPGTFGFEYYVQDSHGCDTSDSLFVHVTDQPVAVAGLNDTICGFSYGLSAVPSTGTGTWSVISGPGTVTFSNINDPSAIANVDAAGAYNFEWREDNGGCYDADTVEIYFYKIPAPVTASDDDTCGLAYPVSVVPDLGNGIWSLRSGPGTATFDDNTSSSTLVSVNIPGTYIFEWTEINSFGCKGTDSIKIDFYPVPVATTAPFDTSGCNPHSVYFNNTSTNANTFNWDFGDGFVSNQDDPYHTFRNPLQQPDTFNVVMIAYNAYGCIDTMKKDVVVAPTPLAKITTDRGPGCSPLTVNFYNKSEGATKYTWDMGDGSPVYTDVNIKHTFYNDSNYIQSHIVTLIAENVYTCKDTAETYITIYPSTHYELTATPDTGCNPLKAELTTDPGAFSYEWDFGDGQSIPGSNSITHIYENTETTPVTFTATLYTTSVFGCFDTSTVDITVKPRPISVFSFDPVIGCAPLKVAFDNRSKYAESSKWRFGDGTEVIVPNNDDIDHVYLNTEYSQKTYKAVLTVENQYGCVDSSENFVNVYPEVNAAISTPDPGCSPHEISLINNSTGANSFLWDFGDGNTSTGLLGKNIYINKSDTSETYDISLIASSVYGCSDTVFTSVEVYPSPKSRFTMTPGDGCAPLNVEFTNGSENVTSSTWKFGTGDEITMPDNGSTTFLYDNNGYVTEVFNVSLVVENNYSCKDSLSQVLSVYPKVKAKLTDGDNGCSPHTVSFGNSSENAATFLWDYGDGNTSVSYSGFNTFINNTVKDVTYNVKLTATSSYGCKDIDSTQITIYRTPQPAFDVTPIEQQMPNSTVTVTNNTPGEGWDYTWLWDDGNITKAEDPGSYTYAGSGEYDIKLIVSGEHCSDSTYRSISILTNLPTIDYGPDAEGCPPLSVQFYNKSTEAQTFMWEFGDGSVSSEKEPEHTYYTSGEYKVKLTVYGPGGTAEAEDVTVKVYETPTAMFEAVPNKIKIPGQSVSFLNRSTGATSCLWDFGDGNTSSEFSLMYEYQEAGVYDVSLEVSNDFGCKDTFIIREAVTAEVGGEISFPNAFTPNPSGPSGGHYTFGDKENYVFYPFVQDGIAEYKLQIFTRWGELIFESNDLKIGWDGYYKGKLAPQGVYIYKATCKFGTGQLKIYTGDVTLLR